MNCRPILALTPLLFVAPWQPVSAEDALWPGWQGPHRNGWVEHFSPPSEWPEKLEQVWEVEVGTGYGSPIVIGKRVYQHGRQGEEEVVRCLDLASGKEQWRKSYAVAFKMGQGSFRHGKGPKSSPVFADGRLFTLSITGVLSAWSGASGDLLWRRDFNELLERPFPYWGTATSPLVDSERIFLHLGTCEAGALLALDVKTGKNVWKQDKHGHCYSSPHVAELSGVRQLVEWNHDGLSGVDLKSGEILWEHSFPHTAQNQNMPTPAIHDGRILVGGENRGMRCVEPRLEGGKWSVAEHWRTKEVALDMSSAIMNGDLLYGMSHYRIGQLFCLDPKIGKVLWKSPPKTGENVTFLSVPGYVLALIANGELRVIKATGDSYQPVRSYRVADEGETWTPPVLLENGLLVKDKNQLRFWAF